MKLDTKRDKKKHSPTALNKEQIMKRDRKGSLALNTEQGTIGVSAVSASHVKTQ